MLVCILLHPPIKKNVLLTYEKQHGMLRVPLLDDTNYNLIVRIRLQINLCESCSHIRSQEANEIGSRGQDIPERHESLLGRCNIYQSNLDRDLLETGLSTCLSLTSHILLSLSFFFFLALSFNANTHISPLYIPAFTPAHNSIFLFFFSLPFRLPFHDRGKT